MWLYDCRYKIIRLFKNKNIKPSMLAPDAKSDRVEESKQKVEESIEEKVKLKRQKADAMSEFNEQIAKIDKTINKELLMHYFKYQNLIDMQEELYKAKNTERYKIQTDLIKDNLKKLKNDIKKMPTDENEIEKPNEIIGAVVEILEFNKNQGGEGLKILTPQQMLSRLSISLAQLKA